VCGRADVDVGTLRANCNVSGFNSPAASAALGWFWAVLTDMTAAERCKFVRYELSYLFLRFLFIHLFSSRFTCGLSRLPKGYSSSQKLKICCMTGAGDEALPRAATCAWTFNLPVYSSKEIMKQRVLTAILNCFDIDNDFVVAAGATPQDGESSDDD
jgi:hypothetical protein